MKKLSGIFAVLLAAFICLTVCACGARYHAVVVDSGIEYTAEFLKSSITYGAWCDNEDYNPEVDDYDKIGWYDSESPKTRTYIVKERSEADRIFSKAPEFNFENEMVMVYCWTEIYSRKVILKSVEVNKDNVLKIEFTLKKPRPGVGDANAPGRRILAVKMDKLEITSVEFTKI